MKNSRLLKLTIIIIFLGILVFLIKSNVTLSKEPRHGSEVIGSDLPLEINSELVQNVYSKLILLDDPLKHDIYKYSYFKMTTKEKTLSLEEKLYITFVNLYKTDKLQITSEDGKEHVVLKADKAIDEASKIFKGDDIEAKSINFSPAQTCGILNYLYTGDSFEFDIAKCDPNFEFSHTKLMSARKENNFVILRVKSYYAIYEKKKKEKEGHYSIKNYNDDEIITTVLESDIGEKKDAIFENFSIDEYDLAFELRGDDYYLSKITSVLKN